MNAETQTASDVETQTVSAKLKDAGTQTESTKLVDARVGTIQVGSGEPYTYCFQLTIDEYEKQKLMGAGGTIEALTQTMFAVADDGEMSFRAKKKWLLKLKDKYPFIWKENNGDELMHRLEQENKGCSIV